MVPVKTTILAVLFLVILSPAPSLVRAAEPDPPALTCLQQCLQKELLKLVKDLRDKADISYAKK